MFIFIKNTIQEIHTLIFLQLDWMFNYRILEGPVYISRYISDIKGNLIFFSIKCFNFALYQLCLPMYDYAFK